MKKIIIFIIIIVILAAVSYRAFFKNSEPDYKLASVARGQVVQQISETGQVEKGDKINLSFKQTGTIKGIYVEVSEYVSRGDILAKLDDEQLKIQLTEAQAALELTQAQLNKILAGPTGDEIKIVQTAVANAETALDSAQLALADITAQGEENLKAAYEDAQNYLDDALLQIISSYNIADNIKDGYFKSTDQQSYTVQEEVKDIKVAENSVKPYLETAKDTNQYQDINRALSEMRLSLEETSQSLKIIREACNSASYKNVVSSADKTSLDTRRSSVISSLTNIVNAQQGVASTKLTNQANVNIYQGKVDSSSGQLQAARDELARLTSDPREEDVDLYQAQVRQAVANVSLLQKSISDTILKSPIPGQIINISSREGEIVQAAFKDTIITLLPDDPFTIKVDIYEEDVALMQAGNPVDISLVAFPDLDLSGIVLTIDPAEKVIDSVVYYEVQISLNGAPDGTKTGMTADLIITTQVKDNVLYIPEQAVLERNNGTAKVQVFNNGTIQEREITVGLEGSNDHLEVLEGLSEGEQVAY